MESININIRMDKELKKQFEAFCNSVGMSMTTAFTIYAKKTISENKIPFEISPTIPNAETRALLDASLKGVEPDQSFNSSDELMEWLESDD